MMILRGEDPFLVVPGVDVVHEVLLGVAKLEKLRALREVPGL